MFFIKPLSSLFGVLVLIFIGWIFLAGMPDERIDRGCRPIGWLGNVTTSVLAIGAPSFASASYRTFANIEYGCRYAVWRLLYEKDWVEQQKELKETARTEGADQGNRQGQAPNSKRPSTLSRRASDDIR